MAQGVAKGELTLTVEQNELEASIRYAPDPNGAEWTADKLLRIIMDARLGGWNQKRAEDLIQKLSRARGPTVEVIARGEAPQAPVPEQPEWADLAVPDELKDVAQALLSEAPPPVLYKVKAETVRVEKIVRKPGALPFLPSRSEKVIVTERREKRELVNPDPAILGSGYAKRGSRVGILSTAKPGKAGKTIFGKPVAAPAEDSQFYAGAGIVRQKNELLADEDGVVRYGERWVDMVPLPSHTWSLELAADGANCLLSYSPGDPRLPGPSAGDIVARAEELGVAREDLVPESELAEMLRKAVAECRALLGTSISANRDARIEIAVSPDGVRASLSIWKGRGKGKRLDLSELSAALKASGVRGFRAEQLKKDVLEFYKGRQSEFVDYLLAEGRAPSRGKDRSLVFALNFEEASKAAPIMAELAAQPGLAQALPSLAEFPIGAAARVARVQLGQRIGELTSGSAGQDGVDVYGRKLPALPGNDPAIRAYENIDFSRGLLTATATGYLLAEELGGGWRVRVVKHRDASIDVQVAPDAMTATVSLSSGEGLGAGLTVEGVIAALNAKGVTQGIEPFSIAEAIADARAGKPVLRVPVAHGRAPRAAGSARLEWLVKRASGTLYRMTEDGRADFKEHDTMTRVEAGQVILKVSKSASSGEDGFDVLGRTVAATAAADEQVPEHDATIREETDDSGTLALVAAQNGELVIEKNRISIHERLSVKGDVGAESGNLRFPGSVNVAGSVLAGFSLVAGGDVNVGGAVESSLVSSDGAIRVGEGVKGARKGTIRARKGIEAAFAEQALLLAVEDIRVRNACILCNVKTNGRLVLLSEKGALIGGLCRARKGVEVTTLGSENYTKTEISFGQDYLVADQIETEEREIERLKALIVQSDRSMSELERAGAGLDRVRQDKVKLVKLLEKRTMRVFDLRERFEEHVPSEVRVRGTVFPGVILESHNRFYEVRSRKTKVVFVFDPKAGRIVERPL